MANKIPNAIIDQIRSAADIVDVVGEQVSLRKVGRNYIGLCPFHQEKTPSFSVAQEKQVYNCFGCGASGNAITFVMEVNGYSFNEAIFEIAKKTNLSHLLSNYQSSNSLELSSHKHKNLFGIHERLAKLYTHYLLNSEDGKEARTYLAGRNITEEEIKKFQIGYAPGKDIALEYLKNCGYEIEILEEASVVLKSESGVYMDVFRQRIVFPIQDPLGRIIAFSGRSVDGSHPKYLNSRETPIFHKNKTLYNFHQARQEMKKKNFIVLFEGFMDVIAADRAGITNGVATMGTAFSAEHLNIIGKSVDNITICFDSDGAGLKAASVTGKMLSERGYQVSVCTMPHNMDPDEYVRQFGVEKFADYIISNPLTYISFQMEYLKKSKNLERAEEFAAYIELVLKEIGQLKNEILQDGYLKKLSEDIQYPFIELKNRLKKLRQPSSKPSNPRDYRLPENVSKGITQFNSIMNAERFLLAYMLKDEGLTEQVKQEIYNDFTVVEHQAIVTYLYAFYEEGNQASIAHFLEHIPDMNLRNLVIQIENLPIQEEITSSELADFLHKIKIEYPRFLRLEKIKKEIEEAERIKDYVRAAKLVQEQMSLKP